MEINPCGWLHVAYLNSEYIIYNILYHCFLSCVAPCLKSRKQRLLFRFQSKDEINAAKIEAAKGAEPKTG